MNGFELITKKEEAFGVFEQTIEYKNHTKAKAFSMEETVVLLSENHLFLFSFFVVFRIESIKHSEGNILHKVQNRSRVYHFLCIRNKPTNWNKKLCYLCISNN